MVAFRILSVTPSCREPEVDAIREGETDWRASGFLEGMKLGVVKRESSG